MARGVETAGDAIEEEPLDRLADPLVSSPEASVELRFEAGKTTAVEILSMRLRRAEEEVEKEEADPDAADGCTMVADSALCRAEPDASADIVDVRALLC